MKRKILFCETNLDGTIGGSFFSLLYLISGLNKDNYDISVVFYKKNGLISKYIQAGAKVYIFELPTSFNFENSPFFSRLLNSPGNLPGLILASIQKLINFSRFFVSRIFKYWFFIKKHEFDLIHLNNTINWNHDWMLSAKLAGKMCITHERGINHRFRLFSKSFGKVIDGIICISNAVKSNLVRQGFNPDKLHLIYNGLDPDELVIEKSEGDIYEELGLDADVDIIGIVGNLKEWKGQETVVNAMVILKKKYPRLVCLLIGDIAEGDRYYFERINNIIRTEKLENNIILTGYKKNTASYMNILKIAIHASINPEPFGRVVIEAMAMKKPVIGSNGGAIPEIIEDGVSGKLFQPGNAIDLSECIDMILSNKQIADEYAINGYNRLLEKFHIKNNVENTEKVYQQLLG